MKRGNRWPDVCALCDRPIDLSVPGGWYALHLYLGPGWVHGGGREEIPVHLACAQMGSFDESAPVYQSLVTAISSL